MIAIADCNSFYASCERLFRPDLIGKPVVVLSNNDGCIVSRTDEAKALNIDMAVPYFQCKEAILKNNVAVFSSNYNLYGDMSWRVMETFRMFMGESNVEVYSVDEAFIDFNNVPANDYKDVALEIKRRTEMWTGIPICVGVAPNKLLSKVANKLSKRNKVLSKGVFVIDGVDSIHEALEHFPVGDLWGIGGRYRDKLCRYGIDTAWKLRNMPLDWCRKELGGVVGERLVRQLRGEEMGYMLPPREEKKMILTSRMFGKPVTTLQAIQEAIATYTSRAAEKLRRQFGAATEMSIFLLYQDTDAIQYNTKSTGAFHLLDVPTSNTVELSKIATGLAKTIFFPKRKYIKGGVVLSKIVKDTSIQGSLFDPKPSMNRALMLAMDNINFSQGADTVVIASAGNSKVWKMRQEQRSPYYTSRWADIPLVR
jgi:DNA polymerase V